MIGRYRPFRFVSHVSLFTVALFTASPAVHAKAPTPSKAVSEKPEDDKEAELSPKAKEAGKHIALAEYSALQLHDLKAAAAELQKALQIDPTQLKAGILLSRIYLMQGNPKQALSTLDKLAKKNPNNGALWRLLGSSKLAAGNEKDGLAALQKAVQIDSEDSEAHFLIFTVAYNHFKAGNGAKDQVLAAAKAFLNATPHRQGLAYKKVERAVVEILGDPLDLVVYDSRNAYDKAFEETSGAAIGEQMTKARKGFERCVAEQPQNERCHFFLAMVYSSVKAGEYYQPQKAKEELRKAPNIPEALVELATVLRKDDNLSEAAATLKKALSLRARFPKALLEQGIVAKLDGREDDAVESFARAFRTDPGSSVGSKAIDELAKLRPDHELVRLGLMLGAASSDVFSTARFTAAVSMLERRFGGVEENAPETEALRQMVSRLLSGSDLQMAMSPKVAVLGTKIVNALALPSGNIYVTRGMLDRLKQRWPSRVIDADHGPLAHVLAHEIAHCLRRHSMQSAMYREAVKESAKPLDPAVLTFTTRLQEMEADRISIVMAFLAGYPPRGGIEMMESEGQNEEIPSELDHPTFDERVHYLEEYWTNDVRFAFQSFRSGVNRMDEAAKLEATDTGKALTLYKEALEEFRRYRDLLKPTKEILNNMGIIYAKLGVVGQADANFPLSIWLTPFSIERETALKYKGLAEEERGRTRGMGGPSAWHLQQAVTMFKEALNKDQGYRRASVNLAVAYIASGKSNLALEVLGKLPPSTGIEAAEVQNLLGVAYAEMNRAKEAETAFAEAQKADPAAPGPLFNAARLAGRSGQTAVAQAGYRSFLAKHPTSPWAAVATKELGPAK